MSLRFRSNENDKHSGRGASTSTEATHTINESRIILIFWIICAANYYLWRNEHNHHGEFYWIQYFLKTGRLIDFLGTNESGISRDKDTTSVLKYDSTRLDGGFKRWLWINVFLLRLSLILQFAGVGDSMSVSCTGGAWFMKFIGCIGMRGTEENQHENTIEYF